MGNEAEGLTRSPERGNEGATRSPDEAENAAQLGFKKIQLSFKKKPVGLQRTPQKNLL